VFKHTHFYHQHIRKAVVAFGTIFNGIQVRRTNAANVVEQSLLVPLHYAPKQKLLARVLSAPDLQSDRGNYSVTLPRLAFEITGLEYDGNRKLPTTQTIRMVQADKSMNQVYVATPYSIGLRLSIFAKNQDDGLQILEQILPYFTPDFNVTITEPPNIDVKRDLNITLGGIDYNDLYEGSFDERTTIIWDLTFSLKMNFYGNINRAEIIKKVIADIYANDFEGIRYTGTATDGQSTTLFEDIFDSGLFNGEIFEGAGDYTVTESDDPTNYTFVEEFDEIFLGDVT
jgi:hypothetical protein